MGEKIYHTVIIAGAKVRVPASVNLEPLELLYRVHGIDLRSGDYSCPACGTVIDKHNIPWNKVCGCGRPFGHRCAARGCDTVIDPELHDGNWYGPAPFCGQCLNESIRDARQRLVDQIPDLHIGNALNGWRKVQHRQGLVDAGTEWMRTAIKQRAGNRFFYIHGSVGSGKTTSATRLAVKAVETGRVKSLFWATDRKILTSARKPSDAGDFWERFVESDLLVIDDLFGTEVAAFSDYARGTAAHALAERFERKRATIITSNEPPELFSDYYSLRVQSRFDACASVVQMSGPDMRQVFK